MPGNNQNPNQLYDPGAPGGVEKAIGDAAKNGAKKIGNKIAQKLLKEAIKMIANLVSYIVQFILWLFAPPQGFITVTLLFILLFVAPVVLKIFVLDDGFTNATGGAYSAFGCNLTRQQFIDACQNYTGTIGGDLATVERRRNNL